MLKKPIQVLLLYGGSEFGSENLTLRYNCNKLLGALNKLSAEVEFCDLKDWFGKEYIGNARPSKQVRPTLELLRDKVLAADVLILATPVHWRLPSMLMVAFIHLILAPLEWGGKDGNGYECEGKIPAIITIFDDDGAVMVESTLNDILGHMALDKPRWNILHTNIKAFESEDNWQNEPEALAPILMQAGQEKRRRERRLLTS